ncbi:C40 family peptidase [Numidum massiliense]|uniref:C40 family peptidase n=1 Tax=Numidum massiliense TaxID=1522315 RepID=UPI0006D557F3|nr:NlpC/P60 family protein [Numidum massiliense]
MKQIDWVVDVAVATVWTAPTSPRAIDEQALTNPVDIKGWLERMTVEERLDLCNSNRVQTQVLYGQQVTAIGEQGEWLEVVIPEQASKKDGRGYPGWIPQRQLRPLTEALRAELFPVDSGRVERETVVVTEPTAFLYKEKRGDDGDPERGVATKSEEVAAGEHKIGESLEISFQTRLPLIEAGEEWVQVATPHGVQFLRQHDVFIASGVRQLPGTTGADVLNAGKAFLGLPYLWGGMSAFGYDCSGFVYAMHRAIGVTIPRDADDQSTGGTAIAREALQPGDLVFFAYESGKGAVHHVGMYAGDDHMIHSPDTGNCVELIPFSTYKNIHEFCGARRYWEEG